MEMLPKAAQETRMALELSLKNVRERPNVCSVWNSFFSHEEQTDPDETNYRIK